MGMILPLALIFAPRFASARTPDGWFHVVPLDAQTYAISEPQYWQQNVSYLLMGETAAVLFDSGPGLYSIRDRVVSITHLPILVIPSHLHYDHVGGVREFHDVALLDHPSIRQEFSHGKVRLTAEQFLLKEPITIGVTRWLRDGERLELGGRTVTVLSTPGHTPESVTLVDQSRNWTFTGDLINAGLYNVPGSNIADVERSLHRLLRELPHLDRAYLGHFETPLRSERVRAFLRTVHGIVSGEARAVPVCMHEQRMLGYEGNTYTLILPSATGQWLQPLQDALTVIDWPPQPCVPVN
jgi:glyoxylase-like metal-dependent hydrolase (beta-lactamase superfamily II)